MTVSVRDLLELTGLALIVATVAVATGLIWAVLLTVAVVVLYLSHFWVWKDAKISRPKVKLPRWRKRAKR